MNKAEQRSGELLSVAILISIAVLLAGLSELLSAAGAPWGVPPRFYLIYAGAWSLLIIPLVIRRYGHAKLLIYAVFLVSLVILWTVPWSSRKQFLKDLYGIRRGMSVAQVDARMRPYMRRDWRDSPGWENCIVYIHEKDGCTDMGVVRFENGKVVNVKFEPD